jgi:putative membrane protein
MKIKTIIIGATVSAAGLGLFSCKDQKDSKELAVEDNKEKLDDRSDKKDAKFLVTAAENDLTEIELGKLAQTRGGAKIKELGVMLENEHTQSLTKLRELAQRKQMSIPTTLTDKGRELREKLEKKDSNDFNKAFVDEIVNAHEDAIDKFEKAGKDAEDAEIRAWANEQIPILHAHLGHAIATKDEVEHKKK